VNLDRNALALAGLAVVALLAAVTAFSPLGPRDPQPAGLTVMRGDPDAGRVALARLGCSSCHAIDGVRAAGGQVGPSLNDLRSRRYVAGRLPNTAENLVRFIVDPRGVSPGTMMPDLDVTELEAWNMVAYLATLGGRR
jgi:cytochrome c